jgi:hypothetical protein
MRCPKSKTFSESAAWNVRIWGMLQGRNKGVPQGYVMQNKHGVRGPILKTSALHLLHSSPTTLLPGAIEEGSVQHDLHR